MAEQTVEQITREPAVKDIVKDPKKVEAGKKLADYHKKAKEALKEKEQRDALIDNQKEKEQQQQDALVKEDDEGSSMDVNAWIPSLSFENVLIIGSIIGITAYSLYTGYKDRIADLRVPSITFGPPPVKNMNEVKSAPKRENSLNDELM